MVLISEGELRFGLEYEFYLQAKITDTELAKLNALLSYGRIVEERGENQYEYISEVFASHDLQVAFAKDHKIIHDFCSQFDLWIGDVAQLDSASYPSALQVSVSIVNDSLSEFGEGVFYNYIAVILRHSAAAQYYINKDVGYGRFAIAAQSADGLRLMVPQTISWGIDNRTCLIRVPSVKNLPRRIEYRLASAGANLAKILQYLLSCWQISKDRKYNSIDPIWGKAFDRQYNLPELPKDLAEAKKMFYTDEVLQKYLKI